MKWRRRSPGTGRSPIRSHGTNGGEGPNRKSSRSGSRTFFSDGFRRGTGFRTIASIEHRLLPALPNVDSVGVHAVSESTAGIGPRRLQHRLVAAELERDLTGTARFSV